MSAQIAYDIMLYFIGAISASAVIYGIATGNR
jgi:hypothetical protein